ncbi:MAG: TorF family putative porin [Bdellovibrionaceae bacterium]|nr:TorF family putative porin [Pseudobdellovibrionaceae bacterium]
MNPRLRFLLAGAIILIGLKFCIRANAQETSDSLQPGKIFGEAGLTTNWVERGVTQTDKGYALQAGVGYRWTQFKMGLWGSNVKLPGTDDNLNLRLYLAYKFVLTTNADLTARYTFNRYYQGGSNNGALTGIDLRIYEYHFLYEVNSNWEGLDPSTRVALTRDWQIPYNLTLSVDGGYNMVKADGFSNYFDVKTLVNYEWAGVTYAVGNTFNSNSGQFDGRGGLYFFLQATAKF